MRWWGWGHDNVSFTHEDKPALAPFLRQRIDLDVTRVTSPPVTFEELRIPEPSLSPDLQAALEQALGGRSASTDALDRLVHARGKSLRDLVRHRRGEVGRLPDVVVRAHDEDEVAAVLRAAIDADAVLIPFGGGTSISGSLEASAQERRTVISLDLSGLSKVLAVDGASRLARLQAGAFGPALEHQ
ncbi:MAG: FAD-binding protein, partial [Actinomycetota bacterium]|nr:FAD-binding protein [Actinomycetota bacterium]